MAKLKKLSKAKKAKEQRAKEVRWKVEKVKAQEAKEAKAIKKAKQKEKKRKQRSEVYEAALKNITDRKIIDKGPVYKTTRKGDIFTKEQIGSKIVNVKYSGKNAVITKEEASMIINRARQIILYGYTPTANYDVQRFPSVTHPDPTYPRQMSKVSCYEFQCDKVDLIERKMNEAINETSIYTIALRLELAAVDVFSYMNRYIYDPYEQYDPTSSGNMKAFFDVKKALFTAITGDNLGKYADIPTLEGDALYDFEYEDL